MNDDRNNGDHTATRAANGQFGPGNPGRPKGAKNRFAEDFWKALADDFAVHGPSAIVAMREADPTKYVQACVQALPKDVSVKHEATDAFVNLWTLISNGQAEEALEKLRSQQSEEVAQSEPDDPVRH